MATERAGQALVDAGVQAEISNVQGATADADAGAGRSNSAADRVEVQEDDAYNHAQALSEFTSLVDALTYPMGARGYALAAAVDRAAAEEARAAAEAAQAAVVSARLAAEQAYAAVLLAGGAALTVDHPDLPPATGSGAVRWVVNPPAEDTPGPALWRDTSDTGDLTGWTRASPPLAVLGDPNTVLVY